VDAVGRAASASRCTSKPDILSAAHHSHHRTLSRPPGAGTGAHPRTPFREFRKSRKSPSKIENRGERRRSAAWQAAGGADEASIGESAGAAPRGRPRAAQTRRGRGAVYVAPGCFAHPKSRAFWLGGGSEGRRAQGQGQ
jgi:hypothetical protein